MKFDKTTLIDFLFLAGVLCFVVFLMMKIPASPDSNEVPIHVKFSDGAGNVIEAVIAQSELMEIRRGSGRLLESYKIKINEVEYTADPNNLTYSTIQTEIDKWLSLEEERLRKGEQEPTPFSAVTDDSVYINGKKQ